MSYLGSPPTSHLVQSPKNPVFAKSQGSCCLLGNSGITWNGRRGGGDIGLARRGKGNRISGVKTYDLAASLATMSDSDIDSCLGLFRPVMFGCFCLLPPSCEDGEGVGTKLNGLGSSLGMARWSKECECAM